MAYKIFLSYSTQENDLAEHIRNSLTRIFKNKVEFVFNNIRGGEKWKVAIQKGLNNSDAILTILTPKYLQRPWAYIEWSAFWLRDKTTYVIVTDDVEVRDIVDPMRDVQFTRIFHESDVISLVESIAEKARQDYFSYDSVSEISNKAIAIYKKLLAESERRKYEIYNNAAELLPEDDFKKVQILWHFYSDPSNRNTFIDIYKRINDNSIKANLLMKLLEKNDLDTIEQLFEFVESKNNLMPLIRGLVENGQENSGLIEKILEFISSSQSTLRSLCEYFIKNRKIDSKVLINAIDLFTNRAELRKVGECLIDNSFITNRIFDFLVQKFYGFNHAELQKLLNYAIYDENYNPEELTEQIVRLSHYNQREAEKVLMELLKKDQPLVRKLIYQDKIITNQESLKRISEHLPDNSVNTDR
jgi:hypothetical protein